MHARTVCLTALALAAGHATAADRFWIAPLLGFWDDTSNWSLSDGGAPGGGLPQNGEPVFFTTRSTCLFDGPGGSGLPIFSVINMEGSGSGQGRTLLSQTAGLLRASVIRVGNSEPRNDLKISGGSLNVADLYVGQFPGGEGLLEVSGTGSVGPVSSSNRLFVGFSEGDGTVDIRGGSVGFEEVYLSIDSNNNNPGGPAELIMTGGSLDVGSFVVGQGGRGFARFFGGTATFTDSCVVGRVAESGGLRPQINVGTGGDLDITGPLIIGEFDEIVGEEPGDGRVLVTGGSLSAGLVSIARDPGTDGELLVSGGFFDATTVRVGRGGDGSFEVSSGQATVSALEIADDASGSGRVEVSGGSLIANTLNLGSTAGGDGTLEMTGGSLGVNTELLVGVQGDAFLYILGGTVDTPLLRVGGSTQHAAYAVVQGGTLLADEIHVERDASGLVPEQFFVREGLVVCDELTVMPGADVRFGIGFVFDARVSTIVNNGSFDFTGAGSVLSGPILFGNIRLLGDFFNNGDFNFRSGAPDNAFAMNLINTSVFDVSPVARAVVGGAITNEATGTILVRRDTPADPGRLEARSASGFTNNGTLDLENGVVATPNGALTNNGTLTGWGVVADSLVNNGQILPIDEPQTGPRELAVGSYQGGPASSLRVVISQAGHNSVVSSGATALDGTINVAFAQGVPLPPRGTEYDLVVSPNEDITGAFSGSTVLGFPCEIINTRDRVFARTLRCNAADFVAPYGILDLSDINTFTAAFMSNNPLADINGDSFLDLADINAFVAAFTGGCP